MFKDALNVVVCLVLVTICFLSLVIVSVLVIETRNCKELKGLNPDLEFQAKLFSGCLVKTPNGIWMPANDGMQFIYLESTME